MHFSRLPGTRVEGERIAEMLGVAAWFEGTALEAQLKAHKSPRILHLATHGFFLPDQQRNPEKIAGPPGTRGAGLEKPLLRSGLGRCWAYTCPRQGSRPAEAADGRLAVYSRGIVVLLRYHRRY